MNFLRTTLILGLGMGWFFVVGCGSTDGGGDATEAPVAGIDFGAVSDEERARLEFGKNWYEVTCMACHQADGQGTEALAPPFDQKWLERPEGHLIRMVLQGLTGPIQVGEKTYNMVMPELSVLSDDQISGVLSYVRWRFGKLDDWQVEAETVGAVREETADREELWTVEALDAL